MTDYDVGDVARVTAAFTDAESGDAVDPSVVKLTIKDPAGDSETLIYGTDAEVVKDSTGNYHADIEVTAAGTWRYRWYSTGEGQAAEEGVFFARVPLVSVE